MKVRGKKKNRRMNYENYEKIRLTEKLKGILKMISLR